MQILKNLLVRNGHLIFVFVALLVVRCGISSEVVRCIKEYEALYEFFNEADEISPQEESYMKDKTEVILNYKYGNSLFIIDLFIPDDVDEVKIINI